jgi:pimeloyl-ACP methyl ester carboxylesterase
MLTTFDQARLFGARHGSGAPAVLALHGWRRSNGDFDAMFGQSLSGVAIDLPGFGATPPPLEAWGSPEYARALLPVLSEMATPVVVVGHSLGGRVAVHLVAMAPELVRGLVLSGAPVVRPSTGPRKPPFRFRAARRLARMHLIPQKQLEEARERYGSPDYRAAEGVMRDVLVKMLHEDYSEQVAAISCPVELVWGDDDSEVPLARAQLLEQVLPKAHLTVCPGAGHLTPLTAPNELRAAVERLSA